MAVLTFKTGASASTRRHGVVYYATKTISPTIPNTVHTVNVLRPAVIPVAPKTILQNGSQIALSYAASWWAGMSAAEQATFAGRGGPAATAYANFINWCGQNILDGVEPYSAWPGYGLDTAFFDCGCIFNPSAQPDYVRVLWSCITGTLTTADIALYVDPSTMVPATYCTAASNTPGLPAPYPPRPASAMRYFGTLFGLRPNLFYNIPWPGGFQALSGLPPVYTTYSEDGYSAYGNGLSFAAWIFDPEHRPSWSTFYGPAPSYLPYQSAAQATYDSGFYPDIPPPLEGETFVPSPTDPLPQFIYYPGGYVLG